jgi:hypothetical protein
MTLDEIRALLAKYEADRFHPADQGDLGDENDYDAAPRIEYRITATGGALHLCGRPGGQPDCYIDVESDKQLAAILSGQADVDWKGIRRD